MDKFTCIGAVVFGLIGACALAASLYAYRLDEEISRWPQVEATVIDSGTKTDAGKWYEIEWTSNDGQKRHLTVYGSHPARGSVFTVRANPDDPDDVSFDGDGLPMPAIIFGVIGLGFLGVVVRVLWDGVVAARTPDAGDAPA
ncbi:DUF3592 domain-containing protein [Planctomycetota bacterium]|nr:DUF3592 domain-containing protein [Planctomycetota bacterium]